MLLKYGRYQLTSILKDQARLPVYKGSTFRGAFGSALKKVVCAVRKQQCDDCLLRSRCVYARTFERFDDSNSYNQAAKPHPYIIEPPPEEKVDYAVGDFFNFNLILLGEFNDYLPYYIYAFEQMGQQGIGKRINGKRARFKLLSVSQGEHEIYHHQQRQLQDNMQLENLQFDPIAGCDPMTLQVECITPLRLKSNNRFSTAITFEILVRAMLRRISSIFNCYGDGEPDVDYRGLVAAAGEIVVCNDNLHWQDWKRYSNRQEKTMLMGGHIGTITFSGDIAPYLPLFALAQKLHIGKQTAFGLGKINYSIK
ncbi:MAG: CRISPR system precrRNA processing endoribonuclease RAMP protein Cas6 [Thermodesulfobacteriota bacterium]|nr:CRISPR system precrRNA processing endoribonuclease RAMP protein Cas6 [Thermodesulfobacteriota bacterium]